MAPGPQRRIERPARERFGSEALRPGRPESTVGYRLLGVDRLAGRELLEPEAG